MASKAVILILGAGPRIGAGVARIFASKGFSVAVAARSMTGGFLSPEGYLHIKVDLSEPATVPQAFEATEKYFGAPPNVVVYNGGFRPTNPPEEPFSTSLEDLKASSAAGFESQYVAAQQAVKGFARLPTSIPKTFIFTGNMLNQIPIPFVFAFAVSKRQASTLIEYGANAYGPRGYRFYYVDERKSLDGRPAGLEVDGEAHGEMYWLLAQPGEQQKWLVTFTKDKGRVSYQGVDFEGNPYKPRY